MVLHVRSAQWEELPLLASIGERAFEQDACYHHFYPFRKVFPEDFRGSFLRKLQNALADPSQFLIVAQRVEANDTSAGDHTTAGPDTIAAGSKDPIAFGLLRRRGPDAAALATKGWILPKPDAPTGFAGAGESDVQVQVKDRSVDEAAIQRFYDEEVAVLGGHLVNTIEYATVAVMPGLQRSGVGRALVQFGFDQCIKDGVPLAGDASPKGLGLYLKMGISIVGNIRLPKHTVQTVDAEGRSVMVDLPEHNMPIIYWIPSKL